MAKQISSKQVYFLHPLFILTLLRISGRREWCCVTSADKAPLVVRHWKMLAMLSSLRERFTVSEFFEENAHLLRNLEEAKRLLSLLERYTVISRKPFLESVVLRHWSAYQWGEAFLYHYATRDYPFVKATNRESYFREDLGRMERYRRFGKKPDIYTTMLPVLAAWNAPDCLTSSQQSPSTLAQYLRDNGTLREQLLFSLHFCFGERMKRFFPLQGFTLKKTIPSGGARHPTEAFFLSFRATRLFPPGVYHYDVRTNRIILYRRGNFARAARKATFDLFAKFEKQPSGMLVLVSEVERAMWRYRDDRSFRAVLIDAGIAMMMFRSLMRYFSIPVYSYQKFDDRAIERLLLLRHYHQVPLYVASIV